MSRLKTDQTEVEDPHCRHDQHVGGARDDDQEGQEGSSEGQPVQKAEQRRVLTNEKPVLSANERPVLPVQVSVVRVGQPEQAGHVHHAAPRVLKSLTN